MADQPQNSYFNWYFSQRVAGWWWGSPSGVGQLVRAGTGCFCLVKELVQVLQEALTLQHLQRSALCWVPTTCTPGTGGNGEGMDSRNKLKLGRSQCAVSWELGKVSEGALSLCQ